MPLPHAEYTATITTKKAYFVKDLSIPSGYHVLGFRIPNIGELFLDLFGNVIRRTDKHEQWSLADPRFILEKIPRKRYIFEPVEVTPDTEVAYIKSEHGNSFMAFHKPYGFMKDSDQVYSLLEEEF